MDLKLFPIEGETIAFVTLYGDNRSPLVTEWNQKVMEDHFGLTINYIKCPFPGVSHGYCMNQVLSQTIDSPRRPTYYAFIDNDALFMKETSVGFMRNAVRNKLTLFGHAWNSQHKAKARGATHPYASQATMCFSSELYDLCGRPDMDHHNPRSDTAEEFTYAVEERGYNLSLIYPRRCDEGGSPLSQTCQYGRGNVYGPNLFYHESRADLEGHEARFVTMAKRIIAGSFLPVVPSSE